MALENLEKLEKALLRFREKYDKISTERDSLLEEVSVLKEDNSRLMKERKVAHDRVETLIKELGTIEL